MYVAIKICNCMTTKNIEIVKYCQEYFGFALPSALWAKPVSKFELSFKCFLSALWLFFLFWFDLYLYLDLYYSLFCHVYLVNKDFQIRF